jgi:hypothetical protein
LEFCSLSVHWWAAPSAINPPQNSNNHHQDEPD